MKRLAYQFRTLTKGPALAAVLLALIAVQHNKYLTAADFEPFHARVHAAVDKMPTAVGDWSGTSVPLQRGAIRLLQPNATYCVRFNDVSVAGLNDCTRTALLLLVQSKHTNDMRGHWPPRCYPSANAGDMEFSAEREWKAGGKRIAGMEYRFARPEGSATVRTTVYNFFVLPEKGVVRDMKDVEQSAEDYQQRYYGAAQFQLVFGGALAEPNRQAERDEIFAKLLAPAVPVIETMTAGLSGS